MLFVHFSSRPPCGTPHTRLPAQERNCPARNPSVDDLAVGMVISNKGKEASISRTTLCTAEELLSFILGQGLKVTVNSIEIQ